MENAMKQEELLKYMKDAIEVETDLATQEQTLERCLKDIENRKPVLSLDKSPEMPAVETPDFSISGFLLVGGISSFLLLIIITDSFIASLAFGALFGIPGIIIRLQQQKIARKNEKTLNAYRHQATNVNISNEKKKNDHDKAVQQCNQSYNTLRSTIQPHINQTKELLDKLYNKNIIYPKYCTLPALTSIYEYFMTGRCTELTGPHGAYNLYEDEVRKDTIINKLDTVIENLEQIRHNQYMLYQQVKGIKENSDAMVSELQQIKGYSITIAELTALNAYYAAQTERNTRISMYYNL